jgi:hypothetical protein
MKAGWISKKSKDFEVSLGITCSRHHDHFFCIGIFIQHFYANRRPSPQIVQAISDKSIRKALKNIPVGLDETYIRVFERIQLEFPERAPSNKEDVFLACALHETFESIRAGRGRLCLH